MKNSIQKVGKSVFLVIIFMIILVWKTDTSNEILETYPAKIRVTKLEKIQD